jgi:hypothetical protein
MPIIDSDKDISNDLSKEFEVWDEMSDEALLNFEHELAAWQDLYTESLSQEDARLINL